MKEELFKMSFEERRELARLLIELEKDTDETPAVAKTFAEAKAYVFDNYGELLSQLAK